MFGFMNLTMRNFSKNNAVIINNALDKMHKGELEVNDILESDELTNDVKTSMSQLSSFFNEPKNIKNLLDYIIKEPLDDDHKKGHKFPFFACEILCSDNPSLLKNIFDENKANEEEEFEDEDNKESQNKKKISDDEIDLDLEENFVGKSLEDHVLNKEEDIAINNDKFKSGDDEDGEKKDDPFEINEMNNEENEGGNKGGNKEDDDLVNIEVEKEENTDNDSSPFEKKEKIKDRYEENDKDEEKDKLLNEESAEEETEKEKEKEETDPKEKISSDSTNEQSDSSNKNSSTELNSEEKEESEEKQGLLDSNDENENKEIKTEEEKEKQDIEENAAEIKEEKSADENAENKEENVNNEEGDEKKDSNEKEEVEVKEDIKIEENEEVDKNDDEVKVSAEGSINSEVKEDDLDKAKDSDLEGKKDEEDQEIEENIVAEVDDENKKEGEKDAEKTDKEKQERKDSLNLSTEKFDTELLDYFFNFLNTEEPLNFVLAGYFAKVFGHFLNQRQSVIMKYILVTKPEIMKLFTKHINRKSIIECIYKILISYSDDIPNSLEIKIDFIKMIIEAFDPTDDEIVTNTCDLILDMFTVRKMYILFITNKSIFQMIFDFVLQNINNDSFKHLIKILIKANENILKDFGTNIVTPTFTCNETQELFFNFTYNVNNLISGNSAYNSQTEGDEVNINIQNLNQQFQLIFTTLTQATEVILKNFVEQDNDNTPEVETTFGVKVRMLGTKRLLEIEYIRSILEILVNAYAHNMFAETLDLSVILNKIVDSGFMKSALKNLYLYEFNSIYQKEFENVVTLILNVNCPDKLVSHLLTDSGLLKSILDNSMDSHFTFHSGRKIRSGYFVTLYELAIIISESKNPYVKKEEDKISKWKDYIDFYIEPIKQRFKEGLLAPSNNELNSFGNFDKHFMDFKPFDQQEKEVEEKQENVQKKIPIKDLMKQSSTDFINGKKTEVIPPTGEKKEDMEIMGDDEDEGFNNFMNDIGINQHVITNDKSNDTENPEFYDNNFWASNNLIVDEVALEELIESL